MSKERIGELRRRALRARDLAASMSDKQVEANLMSYAADLEAEASKLEAETLPSAALDTPGQEPITGPAAIAALKPEQDPEPDAQSG